MNEELEQKLTDRFEAISAKAECDNEVRDALLKAYLAGGEYGYQYAVDKACEWLESMSGYVVCGQKANVNNFRKAMVNR